MEYQIGDFSKISRLSIKTLRYYHEVGILSPYRIDQETGYRYYNERSLEKANVISELRSLEFSIEEVNEILKNHNEDEAIASYMLNKLDEINVKIERYKEIQSKIKCFIEIGDNDNMTSYNEIIIKEVPDILIAAVRFKGKYSDIGRYMSILYKSCGGAVRGKAFSLYYQNEFMEDEADIEICLPVSKIIDKEMVKSRILKGGKAISAVHKGAYENIGKTYKLIIDYINENNCITELPTREIYHKGPGMIFRGNPDKYSTEIQIFRK